MFALKAIKMDDSDMGFVELKGTTVDLNDLIKLRLNAPKPQHNTNKNISPWAGVKRSSLRGRGMEFDEVRVYQPGDDLRSMDWRVTARTNVPHTKLYTEEREQVVHILLDLSPSMRFGTRIAFKSVTGAALASQIAWGAYANHDRVGGIVFNGDTFHLCHPLSRQRGVLRYLTCVADIANADVGVENDEAMSHHLHTLQKLVKPGGRVVIISDFYHFSDAIKRQLQHLALHQQIESYFIYDPIEENLPLSGIYEFESNGVRVNLNTFDKKINATYQDQFIRKLKALKQWHQQYGMRFTSINDIRTH